MEKKDNKTTYMACNCPCEMHKEYNHQVSADLPAEASAQAGVGSVSDGEEKTSSTCCYENKQEGERHNCGCK